MDQFGRVKTYGLVLSPLLPSSSHVPSFHIIFSAVNHPSSITLFSPSSKASQLQENSWYFHVQIVETPVFVSLITSFLCCFCQRGPTQLSFSRWKGENLQAQESGSGADGLTWNRIAKTGFLATSKVWSISFQKEMENKRCKLLRQCLICLYLL